MFDAARRWFTARGTDAALACAPWASVRVVGGLEWLLARGGPWLPAVSRIVADNLRSAGVYSADQHREYFAQIAAHLAGALHIFRFSGQPPGGARTGLCAELARIAAERIHLDESVAALRAAAARGAGVIVMNAHTTNYLLAMARLNQDVPITVLLRPSQDARRAAAKRRWCEITGVGAIVEGPKSEAPLHRLARMADVLHGGGVLVISPDLPQKRGSGVPVRWLGREVYLPAGAAMLALRTGAPLMTLMARPAGAASALVFDGPWPPTAARGAAGWRRGAVQQIMQRFADALGDFIRAAPALWYMWGDKRWTRVFGGDPRYVQTLAAGISSLPPSADPVPVV